MPDAFFGEAVAAAVRLKPDAMVRLKADTTYELEIADELTSWCTAALAKFKAPRYVRFVCEFPMTASGKIQKFKLREEHQQLLEQKQL